MTSSDAERIHVAVRERYARAAQEAGSCCDTTGSATDLIGRTLYSDEDAGALPEAALSASLGCGNPTMLADLHPGEVVLDLGSGGGIDVLLSARRVAPSGKAYGLDMTPEMLDLARRNQAEAGVTNAEFLEGTMESVPLPDEVGRRDHLELRGEPVTGQTGGVARGVPRPAARWSAGNLGHRAAPAATGGHRAGHGPVDRMRQRCAARCRLRRGTGGRRIRRGHHRADARLRPSRSDGHGGRPLLRRSRPRPHWT